MSLYIPNSYQTPNFYTDVLEEYLLSEETKVLFKAIREIIGFHDNLAERSAFISYAVFLDGKYSKDGKKLACGCGLSRSTLTKVLCNLDRFKILVKVGKSHHSKGQRYTLNFDTDFIDWAALEKRKQEREQKHKEQIAKARSMNPKIND